MISPDVTAGRTLYGDDFGPPEIERWFEREKEGYFDLVHEDGRAYYYGYNAINIMHGFSALGRGRPIGDWLAFGCARGDEVYPVAGRVRRFTCMEPSTGWWRDEIQGTPATYLRPAPSGTLPLADETFEVVSCLDVLHHVPNVSHVLAEFFRVLKPGGLLILREPTFSMGDWTKPRKGLTANERGLPEKWLKNRLQMEGFRLKRWRHCMFPGTMRALSVFGIWAFNYKIPTFLDWVLCEILSFNRHYHRDTIWKKMAPSEIFAVCQKPITQIRP